MKNRYSFTADGLANLAVYGVDPHEVWEVLHTSPRMTRQLTGDAVGIFGITARRRQLLVLVVESTQEDNDWDVVAARDMDTEEIALFNRLTWRPS